MTMLWCLNLTIYILGAVPYAIIGGLTRFQPASSTVAQRVWLMFWLTAGILVGPYISIAFASEIPWHAISGCAYIATAVGGLVVVGQMLAAYGSCSLLS